MASYLQSPGSITATLYTPHINWFYFGHFDESFLTCFSFLLLPPLSHALQPRHFCTHDCKSIALFSANSRQKFKQRKNKNNVRQKHLTQTQNLPFKIFTEFDWIANWWTVALAKSSHLRLKSNFMPSIIYIHHRNVH